MNEFTGERVIPGQVEIDLWNEHFRALCLRRRFASGKRVLDVGCGSGYGSAELSRTAASVASYRCLDRSNTIRAHTFSTS